MKRKFILTKFNVDKVGGVSGCGHHLIGYLLRLRYSTRNYRNRPPLGHAHFHEGRGSSCSWWILRKSSQTGMTASCHTRYPLAVPVEYGHEPVINNQLNIINYLIN